MMVGTKTLIEKWQKNSWRIDVKYSTSTKCSLIFSNQTQNIENELKTHKKRCLKLTSIVNVPYMKTQAWQNASIHACDNTTKKNHQTKSPFLLSCPLTTWCFKNVHFLCNAHSKWSL